MKNLTVYYTTHSGMGGTTEKEINFKTIKEFESWILDNIWKAHLENAVFPEKLFNETVTFEFPIYYSTIPILLIRTEKGILFSDGTYTNKKCFISKTIISLCKRLNNKINEMNNFIEE